MAPALSRTLRPENIPVAISAFRTDDQVPVLNDQYFDGGQCRIFKVDFWDGESWAVRIPVHVESDSQETIISVMQHEQAVLQEIGGSGFPWAPKHHGSSCTFENEVGFPFMALSWIKGSPLSWTPTYPSRPIRDKVLAQVARIQICLIECTKETSGVTSSAFFSRIIQNKIGRVRNGRLSNISEKDCFDQKDLLTLMLLPELEGALFAIDHGDLSPANILIDSEHNVTGIIDWGFASKVPLQLAARMPYFLQLVEPVLPPIPTLQEDRKAYIASIRLHSSQIARWILLVQSPDDKDVDLRHCYLESLVSKGMHRSLADLRWKLPSQREP